MVTVRSIKMDTRKFALVLLLYSVITVHCYPSKPLNERSPSDLTWQAWLLVDDQNQNKQQTNSDGMLRRRITPKSLFISPTFSPESLPACAEGYTSDFMGRCVPIIKIDEDAHYGFLIERIRQKFGPIDYDYQTDEDPTTQGPLQVNIPLQIEEEEETETAIIISPTKPLSGNVDKRDSADEEKQEVLLKKLAAASTKQPSETTTEAVTITTEVTTDGGDVTAATEPMTTTEEVPVTESHNTKRSTDDLGGTGVTTTEELPETTTDLTTTTDKEITTKFAPISFKFPEEVTESSFVKFPDSSVSFPTQIPSSVSTRDVSKAAMLSDAPATNRRVVFRDESQPEVANLDYSNGVRHLPATTTSRNSNKGTEKSNGMFLLPPRWSQPDFQRPLVLRFSRKHAFLDESLLKRPDYYRAVPMDDYAYLFSKHRHSSHR